MRIVDSWYDEGDTYFKVEIGEDRFVDVRSPERSNKDYKNGFLHVIDLNGGNVYSSDSDKDGVAVDCLAFLDLLSVLDYVSEHADEYLERVNNSNTAVRIT